MTKSYLVDGIKNECTGCRSCYQICTVNAIEMQVDEEGFEYPVIDEEKCIKCGICESLCKNRGSSFENKSKYFAGINVVEQEILSAASGGAFAPITNVWCGNEEEYSIYGAVSDGKRVYHKRVCNLKDVTIFKKSKYVQSDVGDCYYQVKKDLIAGKKVVFSGTPCQVDGLRSYLSVANIATDCLLCVDIMCHGVPSSKIYQQYLCEFEEKYNCRIKDVYFKKKIYRKMPRKWYSKNLCIVDEKGKEYVLDMFTSCYLRAFQKTLIYRPSCYNCKYANPNRIGDITIGDFWNIEKMYADLDVQKGVSLIALNSMKAKLIKNELEKYLEMRETPSEFVLKVASKDFYCKSHGNLHPQRKIFYQCINKGQSVETAVNVALGRIPLLLRVKRHIGFYTPRFVRNILKYIRL